MNKTNLTVGIIAKNASATIESAIQSVDWADAIIILDDNSNDNTVQISESAGAKVYVTHAPNFAAKRNELLKYLQTDWIFYLDSDEVVSPKLAKNIQQIVTNNRPAAYRIKRVNFFLDTKMYPDYVDRLFHKSIINGWSGDVHESPKLTVSPETIEQPIIHHTHADITSMLEKTNKWSEFEAELRIKANHPPIAWWRLIRIAFTEWWHQFVHLKVGRFGRSGFFEGYFQIIDKLIVYTKVWEKQRN